jgi:hypothetical protein
MRKLTAKDLFKLADRLYNPETKDYLPLCSGTLQNGPCPRDKKRTMHCGLGELYFFMTGNHPETEDVQESDVVEMAVEACTLKVDPYDVIERSALSPEQKKICLEALEAEDDPSELRVLLDNIPDVNDEGAEDSEKTSGTTAARYRARARRVSKIFREIAELIK